MSSIFFQKIRIILNNMKNKLKKISMISFRLNAGDYDRIYEKAEEEGKSVGRYVREIVLSYIYPRDASPSSLEGH